MRADRDLLCDAIQKDKIPEIIVGYLKLQQAKNNDFFNLFMDKKINGRLFYNTCLPNGTKEVRFGNDDFLHDDFRNVIDTMLAPFSEVTLENVRSEFVKPTEISEKMNGVIASLLADIESHAEWIKFWESEINLSCTAINKKQLYNLIASNAAYKALVSCIDHSKYILDPKVKRNVAVLIGICTGKYESKFLQATPEFQFNRPAASTHHGQDKISELGVFKAQSVRTRRKTKMGHRRKTKKRQSVETETMAMK